METTNVDFYLDYVSEFQKAALTVDPQAFAAFVQCMEEARDNGQTIYTFGNGGSGSSASHVVCDINKGASYGKPKRFKMVCLNDNIATILAYANDVAYSEVFVEQLKNFLQPGDLVIGISGSGNSPNVLKAIEYANQNGGKTFGFCGFGGGKLAGLAQNSLVVHSNDMQKVEDLHMMVFHMAMQVLCR